MESNNFFQQFDQKGQGLVEYALILVLVAVVVIAVLLTLGPTVGAVFSDVVEKLGYDTGGVIAGVAVQPRNNTNTVKFSVTVTADTNVTATISGGSATASCLASTPCAITLNSSHGVTGSGGTATITAAAGGRVRVSYPSYP